MGKLKSTSRKPACSRLSVELVKAYAPKKNRQCLSLLSKLTVNKVIVWGVQGSTESAFFAEAKRQIKFASKWRLSESVHRWLLVLIVTNSVLTVNSRFTGLLDGALYKKWFTKRTTVNQAVKCARSMAK